MYKHKYTQLISLNPLQLIWLMSANKALLCYNLAVTKPHVWLSCYSAQSFAHPYFMSTYTQSIYGQSDHRLIMYCYGMPGMVKGT